MMPKKILVVDDEPDIQKVIMLRLRKTGYDVLGAPNGAQTVEAAIKASPDLIILDFYLPDMNGDHVIKRLKENDDLKNIPIILMSATSKDVGEKVIGYKVEGYLNKPFEPEDLVSSVKSIIG